MRRRPLALAQSSALRLSPLALQILDYLRTHPDAEDTLHGIAEWWSLEQRIHHQTAQVRAAISELLAQGLIIQCKARNRRACYRLNPRKHKLLVPRSPKTPAPHQPRKGQKPGQ